MRFLQLQTGLLFVGLSCLFVTDQVEAQLIRITPNGYGGVNIRAPLVRINTNPYGPSHVRAPFVVVNSPPPWYQPQPYYVQPPYNSNSNPPIYSAPTYGVPSNGTTIVQPPDSGGSVDVAPSYPPGSYTTESKGAASSDDQPIQAMDREAPLNTNPVEPELKSVLEPAVDRENDIQVVRRDLIASSNALHQSLTRYSNATVWQEYLALPLWVRDDSSLVDSAAIDQDQMNQVMNVFTRFEKTNGAAEMHLINNLEEFRRMHRELASFVGLLQNRSFGDTADFPPPPVQDGDR